VAAVPKVPPRKLKKKSFGCAANKKYEIGKAKDLSAPLRTLLKSIQNQ
jgi:hypothetical protein